MPDQTRLSSSEFSPDQGKAKFYGRFKSQPWWNKTLSGKFPKKSMHWSQGWPWGYFIYRTAYSSDEDWNQALAKLNRYIYCTIRYKDNPEPAEIVWEGYKNVIVDDKKLLEGAPPTKVRQLFHDWIKHHLQHNHCSISRSAFCLMIDNHALQSILASPEPSLETGNWITEKNGYVVLIDRYFPDRGFRHEPYNVDWVLKFECRYPAIGKPGLIPYFDGEWNWVDDVNRRKVTDIDSSGDVEEEEDYDDVESDYGYHDIYQYLREGAYLNLNLFNVQYACSL
ncbi:uncharacterized protein BDW43DRAFT_321888 [Aspergillus alliaceus]|uniref:uncharacterized protein n=1 Tax=Petromyces alliaceus TaxID=209559 RepID=UPI0012A5E895|nr:uncharacterized protein BDW43DRAFT_321888 [Aspergillus alliaceus]KAB8237521.1 hypothetical protein BDW43DRAFT_321888 [Aspergillus alliaceus]